MRSSPDVKDRKVRRNAWKNAVSVSQSDQLVLSVR